MKKIGFANKFFTLWDIEAKNHFSVDSNGNSYLSGRTIQHYFIKNISKDIDRVKKLFPNIEIDMNLKGSKVFSVYEQIEEKPVDKFSFGKYYGKTFAEVAKSDLNYIVWILENHHTIKRKAREALEKLPEVIEHKKKEKEAIKNIIENSPTVKKGDKIKVHFEKNPQLDIDEISACCWGVLEENSKKEKLFVEVTFPESKLKGNGKYSFRVVIIDGVEYKLKNNQIEFVVESVEEKFVNSKGEAIQFIKARGRT